MHWVGYLISRFFLHFSHLGPRYLILSCSREISCLSRQITWLTWLRKSLFFSWFPRFPSRLPSVSLKCDIILCSLLSSTVCKFVENWINKIFCIFKNCFSSNVHFLFVHVPLGFFHMENFRRSSIRLFPYEKERDVLDTNVFTEIDKEAQNRNNADASHLSASHSIIHNAHPIVDPVPVGLRQMPMRPMRFKRQLQVQVSRQGATSDMVRNNLLQRDPNRPKDTGNPFMG